MENSNTTTFQWVTEITAVDPLDGSLKRWIGPNVPGDTESEANEYCQMNGLGYCRVIGKIISEVGWNSALFATRLEKNKN